MKGIDDVTFDVSQRRHPHLTKDSGAGFGVARLVVGGSRAFDYHGYSNWDALVKHTRAKANRWWPGWSAELIELLTEVLVSGPLSRTYDGLSLREPKQFLHDALPRAERFVRKYPAPPE